MRILPEGAFDSVDRERKAHSVANSVDCGGPSPTQQHLKDEADINVIMRRFGVTGSMPGNLPGAVYGDFSGISGWEDAVELVERARGGFDSLPAAVRERFRNEPGEMVRFAARATPEEFAQVFVQADSPVVSNIPPVGSSLPATGEAVK